MIRTLTKEKGLYYYKNGKKKVIIPSEPSTYPRGLTGYISGGLTGYISGGLTGDISSGLWGDISSGLWGNISGGLTGEISGRLTGYISGLWGDATGINGNLNDCELTLSEREKSVDIRELLKQGGK